MSLSASTIDPVQLLDQRVVEAIRRAFPEAAGAEAMISPCKQAALGDFQSNAAMPLAKKLGKNPREVAKAIVAALDVSGLAEPVTDASIAGPGFINIMLKPEALAGLLGIMDRPTLGVEPSTKPMTVVVDLCGVNLAKQMHVGHLRSIIIGDTLARTLDRVGHKVVRQNHVGDWGLNIAMVISSLLREHGDADPTSYITDLDQLEKAYRKAQNACKTDTPAGLVRRFSMGPKAEAEWEEELAGLDRAVASLNEAKRTLVNLQSGSPREVRAWEQITRITLAECLRACAALNTIITDEHTAGESSYRDELAPLVEELISRGIAEETRGALVVRVEGIEEPCIIRKTDGGYLYATTDLCAIRRRVQKLGADRVIYCVDARQGFHFKQVFGAALRAGLATKPGTDQPALLEHAAFGMVMGPDGRPFKTRSGENVKLMDLIGEATERALAVVEARSKELPAEERAAVAKAVGVAAMKYADLSTNRVNDYVFDYGRMLAFEGNTGPYLLYALVRTKSIFRKAAERGIETDISKVGFTIAQPAERALALALLRYPAAVASVVESLEPHRLCVYLYELAGSFSSFFDACPVLSAEGNVREARLKLCHLTARVLEDGLRLLGMPTVERM
jgi:arginyl-tRNA synthetase